MDQKAILIGYQAKKIEKRPAWLQAGGVEEVCSVSNCISPGLPAWGNAVGAWTHNGLGFWDSESSLADAQMAADFGDADRFFYVLAPMSFGPDADMQMTELDLPDFAGPRPDPTPPPAGYERIGYDCVQTEWGSSVAGFGCSPLSCNYLAQEIVVNRYCLIDSFDKAIDAARMFAQEQPEPGIYCIVEVWRKRRGDGGS